MTKKNDEKITLKCLFRQIHKINRCFTFSGTTYNYKAMPEGHSFAVQSKTFRILSTEL